MDVKQHPACGRPVFVVGCSRSGTALLMYHTLLSSCRFAHYRAEPAVFDLLAPRIEDPKNFVRRKKLIGSLLKRAMFRKSKLARDRIEPCSFVAPAEHFAQFGTLRCEA